MISLKTSLAALLASSVLFAPPALSQGRIEVFGSGFGLGVAPTGTGFVQVSGGEHYNAAIHADGSLWTWGSDSDGQVSNKPSGTDFTLVSAGARHAVALRSDGSLEAWGSDSQGQVSGAPVGKKFIHAAAGDLFSVAVDEDGFIFAWGSDFVYGVVSGAPTGPGFAKVTAGRSHAIAIRDDGSLVTWGLPPVYQGSTPAGIGFVEIAAGDDVCIALHTDGSLRSWGTNTGMLLANTPSGTGFLGVAASRYTLYAQKSNGLLTGWGGNPLVPSWGVKWFGLNGGSYHAVALWELDCDFDGTPDYTEIESGESQDCNGNEVPDACDISSGFSSDLNGDGIPDECVLPGLSADVTQVSLGTGGVQNFLLTTPVAGDGYLLLGSTSGTSPGITLGSFTLPLNQDSYLMHTLANVNTPPLSGSFGFMSPSSSGGTANATFTLPIGLDPALVGLTVHHAFATLNSASASISFVSNAVPVVLVP